jgi:hypothetical protein
MIVCVKRILAACVLVFTVSVSADNNAENSASPVTTTIEQPASVSPEVVVNDSGTGSPSKPGDSKATNSALSTAVDNVNTDVKKSAVLIDDLSSQINDLKTQIISVETSVKNFEDTSKGNFKILLSLLIVLLIIGFVGLFKKCSCKSGPTQ